jgi:protein-L-isoaspartate(D-aspartate) O-methyltransferase
MKRHLISLLIAPWLAACGTGAAEEGFAQRDRMVSEVRAMAASVEGRGHQISPAVYDALRRVPRHVFVPESLQNRAYHNTPLSIGRGQTISQPYIVALMTDLIDAAGARILEIGTGSGYQAAVLAEMGAEVYTIEIVESLGAAAAKTLARHGYGGVHTRVGDGYLGWPEAAPFDGIIVTAAPDHVPQPLIDQLKTGGRMVIPVGPSDRGQRLFLMRKKEDGTLARETIIPVNFVPLTGRR